MGPLIRSDLRVGTWQGPFAILEPRAIRRAESAAPGGSLEGGAARPVVGEEPADGDYGRRSRFAAWDRSRRPVVPDRSTSPVFADTQTPKRSRACSGV